VVSPFAAIGFEGTDYKLAEINENSVSNKLKKALNDIRTGKVADTFGWVWKV
jgi:branched-chain amino acid aminotransferase